MGGKMHLSLLSLFPASSCIQKSKNGNTYFIPHAAGTILAKAF